MKTCNIEFNIANLDRDNYNRTIFSKEAINNMFNGDKFKELNQANSIPIKVPVKELSDDLTIGHCHLDNEYPNIKGKGIVIIPDEKTYSDIYLADSQASLRVILRDFEVRHNEDGTGTFIVNNDSFVECVGVDLKPGCFNEEETKMISYSIPHNSNLRSYGKFLNYEIRECLAINEEQDLSHMPYKYELVIWAKPDNCFAIAHLTYDTKEGEFEFKSVGLRYLDYETDDLSSWLLTWCKMQTIAIEREMNNAEEDND